MVETQEPLNLPAIQALCTLFRAARVSKRVFTQSARSLTVAALNAFGLTSGVLRGFEILNRLCQRRDNRKEVAHDAIIGNTEDGRFRILIDCHNVLG